ncbi:hypothetical protein DCS_01339 [Drechmeria coniospora]|uniref:GPI anchored serine-rich protein n=1 Tax=Drechmeria coniospora TaxID=98403 RepID=A0A151GT09_DRECN|nr:hypothetical protein DCS_01339 [Drechmeria coniospora]KYK60203.1 hypothetical protein DCS_01339 [Drechmeria coniospora]
MRFSTVALMAVAAEASNFTTTTDYSTQLVTVTACADDVTDCPVSKTTSVSSSAVPMTTSIKYETKIHTVTSCPETVTDCPARSTMVSTETIATYTTVCPVASVSPSSVPRPNYSNSTMPSGHGPCGGKPCPPSPVAPAEPKKSNLNTGAALPTSESACPSFSVTSVTKTYTTVLSSVEVSTIAVPCPTETEVVAPIGTASPSAPVSNKTAPGVGNAPLTAGASSFAGSALFAVAAGLAAFVLA